MTKFTANDVIKVAKKYVGYLEKETNKQLESMKANAGDENYTIFAKKFDELTGINNQGSAWCDMYVDVCFAEAFGKEKAKELLGGYSAYTPTSAQYFKNKNQWYTKNPKIGDVIFFKNSERICHTGLVIKVTSSTVYTIEGNTSAGSEVIPNGGAVCEKQYLLSNSRIAGYGRPKYDETVPITPVDAITKDSSEEDIIWLQTKLNLCLKNIKGFVPLKVDGDYGVKTISAIKLYWQQIGWSENGCDGTKVGMKTITALASGKTK